MGLFSEELCEVEAGGLRYLPRQNELEAARERHRLEDELVKLKGKVEQRNEQVQRSPRSKPEPGLRSLQLWAARHRFTGQVELRLEGRSVALQRNQAAIDRALELGGCYVVVSDVPKLLAVRPVWVRKESRTRGDVFSCMLALKLSREMERRLQARFGTTDTDPHATTLPDAMAALSRLCLLEYQIDDRSSVTRLPKPDACQREILAALDVQLPER